MKVRLFNIVLPVSIVVFLGFLVFQIMELSINHDLMTYYVGNTSYEIAKLEQLIQDYERIIEWMIKRGGI